MLTENDVIVRGNPAVAADELFAFYERNNICEVGFGKGTAARMLRRLHLIIANSNPLLFRIFRLFAGAWRGLIRGLDIKKTTLYRRRERR